MNWWRAYHGVATDPKYRVVLRHIASHGVTSRHEESQSVRLSDVTAIWVWLVDFASQNTPRGSIEGFQVDHIAIATGLTDEAVESVLSGFRWRKMITDNLLTAFEKRQPSSTFRMRKSRETDSASHRVTSRHEESQSVTPLARDTRSQSKSSSSSSGFKKYSAKEREGKRENLSSPVSFEFPDWFESIYRQHPKKKNRGMAESRLCEVKGIESPEFRAEFDRVHKLWCATESWTEKNGSFAPELAQWIMDKSWMYPPNGSGGTGGGKPESKSKYKSIPEIKPEESIA